jgi:hypothetical protein
MGKSKARIEEEDRVARDAAMLMERHRIECLAIQAENSKLREAEGVRSQWRSVVQERISSIARDMGYVDLLAARSDEAIAETFGDLLLLDRYALLERPKFMLDHYLLGYSKVIIAGQLMYKRALLRRKCER